MEAIMNLEQMEIITAAFGQFLPSKLLDSMDFAVNVHASLPKHRGGAPIHYALIQGMRKLVWPLWKWSRDDDGRDFRRSIPITDEDNVSAPCLRN